ncbi:MAG: 4-alpha-glucanotransferase, partial [Limisphaerales bacterium]
DFAQKLVNSVSFQSQIKKFQKSSCVNYFWEMALRRKVLELLAEFFFSKPSARRNVFDRYLSAHPRLRDYASFRATTESRKTSWHNWLVRLREGPLRAGDYSETAARYHQYVQWIAQEQMNDVLDTCRKSDVKFYLDLPLGVNPDGYDVWREKQNFVSGVNAGAPPDIFFTRGQDWGFAPLHPQTIRENHYRHVLDVLRFQMKHTGLLRLDHVMSLYRLYWIPQQFPASEGVYVHYPLEELCALLNLESHRNRTVLVGENLGTVPPEVNAAMQQNHLRQMYVVQTELRPDPKRALSQPGQRMVASLNTHDMPPFAAFLDGSDIDHQVTLGLINDAKSNHQQRRKAVAALEKFLRRKHLLKAKKATAWELLRGCLHFLARSKAEVVLVNLEDLWREHVPQNIPGTGSEQPNWRHKACLKLESIINSPKIKELLAEVDSQRRER